MAKIEATKKRLEKRFAGKTTSDGKVIKNVDPHFVIRMLQRNISEKNVKIALFFVRRSDGNKSGTYVYKLDGLGIIYDEKSHSIKSAIYKKGDWK